MTLTLSKGATATFNCSATERTHGGKYLLTRHISNMNPITFNGNDCDTQNIRLTLRCEYEGIKWKHPDGSIEYVHSEYSVWINGKKLKVGRPAKHGNVLMADGSDSSDRFTFWYEGGGTFVLGQEYNNIYMNWQHELNTIRKTIDHAENRILWRCKRVTNSGNKGEFSGYKWRRDAPRL